MDVREKLVELLKECEREYENVVNKTSFMPNKAKFVADYLISRGVTVQEWISVKDRLPEVGDSYIVCLKMKYSYEKEWDIFTDVAGSHGDYIEGFWDTFHDWDEGQEIHITHWMPLPQPPKGE